MKNAHKLLFVSAFILLFLNESFEFGLTVREVIIYEMALSFVSA